MVDWKCIGNSIRNLCKIIMPVWRNVVEVDCDMVVTIISKINIVFPYLNIMLTVIVHDELPWRELFHERLFPSAIVGSVEMGFLKKLKGHLKTFWSNIDWLTSCMKCRSAKQRKTPIAFWREVYKILKTRKFPMSQDTKSLRPRLFCSWIEHMCLTPRNQQPVGWVDRLPQLKCLYHC